MINIAVLERAAGECDLFSTVVDQQRASDERALVISTEIQTAAEIESLCVENLAPYDPFFIYRGHVRSQLPLQHPGDLREAIGTIAAR
jgi:hypothetical protein